MQGDGLCTLDEDGVGRVERKDHAVREEGEISGTVEAAAVVALLSCLQTQFAEQKINDSWSTLRKRHDNDSRTFYLWSSQLQWSLH